VLLRGEEFVIGGAPQRLSLGFFHAGSTDGAESRLSIDALPQEITPRLRIEWPAAAGAAPHTVTETLGKRCCYWEFYNDEFRIPANISPGKAKVYVEWSTGASPLELTRAEFEVPVVVTAAEKPD
jgi:hypothetical protein